MSVDDFDAQRTHTVAASVLKLMSDLTEMQEYLSPDVKKEMAIQLNGNGTDAS